MPNIVASTAASILCATLSQYLSTRQSELYSELICWLALPFLMNGLERLPSSSRSPGKEASQAENAAGLPTTSVDSKSGPRPGPLWLVTLGVVIVSISKTELPLIELYPTLTPLLLIIQHVCAPDSYPVECLGSGFLASLQNTILGTTVTALFSIASLPGCLLLRPALSLFPIIGLLLVYSVLAPSERKRSGLLQCITLEDSIRSLSRRITLALLVVLGIQTVVYRAPVSAFLPTLCSGVLRASAWYFTARISQLASWRVATSIGTFSLLSTVNPLSYSSSFRALSYIVASLPAIAQIIGMLPKTTATCKTFLWAFALIPTTSYLATEFSVSRAQQLAQRFENSSQPHPVETLTADAKEAFDGLTSRQSRTFDAASAEYRRRYGMDPPPGFRGWYDFAVSNQSPAIDDFDTIYDSVSPFWKISGLQVSEMMREAQRAPNSELWLCSFSAGSAQTSCEHPHRTFDRKIGLEFSRLMRNASLDLPDFSFLVNHLDEPAVVIPPTDSSLSMNEALGRLNLTHMSLRPVGKEITKLCPARQLPDESAEQNGVHTFGLPFVVNQSSAMDLCQHGGYSNLHGFFMSPNSFRLIEGLVPVLSTGAPLGMKDILFPSPAYSESEFEYDESHDVEWDQKRNNLYWAGSTTGGFANSHSWRNFHRQRFVDLVQNPGRKQQYHYLDPGAGAVASKVSSFLNLRQYDVAFTKVVGCDRRHCRDQRTYFNIKSWADKDEALRSRLVFDVDGNGISGRFYKLLASRSTPLKMTIFREWHDDRLVPWYHYIPISLGMEELPELVMHLTSTESGERTARNIAEQGRQWHSEALRDVDKAIYLYRLLLELARLQDPERKAT